MKTIIKLAMTGLLTFILSIGTMSGQEQSSAPANRNGRVVTGILSAQQKEMLKLRNEKKQSFRKAFKASISEKQRDILGDPRVMPAERQKAFRASLTDQQVEMIKTLRADMKSMREEFRATLTPTQKTDLKKLNMPGKMRPVKRFRNNIEGISF